MGNLGPNDRCVQTHWEDQNRTPQKSAKAYRRGIGLASNHVCVQLIAALALAMLVGCAHSESRTMKKADDPQAVTREANILRSWQGDYPVAQLKLLPGKQREKAGGFITDAKTFETVWKAFKPGKAVPKIDFKTDFVLFARNTQFYNRIRIGKVNVINGVAEVLAMETMSAMPIEEKVAMSLVVVPRQGISWIRAGDEVVPIKDHR
jgi:hypothetical protein